MWESMPMARPRTSRKRAKASGVRPTTSAEKCRWVCLSPSRDVKLQMIFDRARDEIKFGEVEAGRDLSPARASRSAGVCYIDGMAQETAVVVVSAEWINSSARILVTEGKSSTSTGETHLLIAPLEDASDPHGLWLSGITTTQLTKDNSPVTMKLMVPWSVILAVGIISDEQGKVKPGFVASPSSKW